VRVHPHALEWRVIAMSTMRTVSLITLILAATLLASTPAFAACGGSTPFPQCDDVCPLGLVCANSGGGCGCVAPTSPCQDPGNPDGPPVCYGSCPNQAQVCATLAGGCACIPTLSEWGVVVMSLLMFGSILWLRRRDLEG
jgi:hypothetical protein